MDTEEVSAIAAEINRWIEEPDPLIKATGQWEGDLLRIEFKPKDPLPPRGRGEKPGFHLTVEYQTAPGEGGGTSVTTTLTGVVYVDGKRVKLTSFRLHPYDGGGSSTSINTCLFYLEDYFVRAVRREAQRYRELAEIHERVASQAEFI